MRRFDKLKNIREANLLAEQRYLTEVKQLLTEKDGRKIITGKIGLNDDVANWCHRLSDKYSIWIANAMINRMKMREHSTEPVYDVNKYFELRSQDDYSNKWFEDVREYWNRIVLLLRTDNKPKTNLNDYPSFGEVIDLTTQFQYIRDWAENPNVPTPNLRTMTWDEALAASTEWHQSLKGDGTIKNEQGTTIHKFDDGFYWINTHKRHCSDEGDAAGHCGTASERDMVLISLRKNKEVFITMDYSEERKQIIQIKGKGNAKPIPKYHPYIMWFISDPNRVQRLDTDTGYKPETNFQLGDLPIEMLNQVLDSNPTLYKLPTVQNVTDSSIIYLLSRPKLFKEKMDTVGPLHYTSIDFRLSKILQKLSPEVANQLLTAALDYLNDFIRTAWGLDKDAVVIEDVKDIIFTMNKINKKQDTVKNNREFDRLQKVYDKLLCMS